MNCIHTLGRINSFGSCWWNGNRVSFIKLNKNKGGSYLNLPKVRKNKYVEIIPINTGCLNNCTYEKYMGQTFNILVTDISAKNNYYGKFFMIGEEINEYNIIILTLFILIFLLFIQLIY